jgi:hypothetical protein
LHHLKDTANGVNDLFNTFAFCTYDENTKAAIPFNEKGIELVDQAIVKEQM